MVILFAIVSGNQNILKAFDSAKEMTCIQVFEGLANFQYGNDIMTIQNPEIECSAISAVLAVSLDFRRLSIRPGDKFVKSKGGLSNGFLSFSWSGAKSFSSNLKTHAQPIEDDAILQQISLMKTAIVTNGRAGVGIGNALIYDSFKPVGILQAKFVEVLQPFEEPEACDMERFLSVARKLVGLGHGLTPSGDDFIVGFLSVLEYFRSSGELEGDLGALRSCVLELIDRTTVVSGAFLKCAAAGEYAESLIAYYQALGSDSVKLSKSLYRIAQHGSSSGVDTLNGMLFGMKWVYGTKQRS